MIVNSYKPPLPFTVKPDRFTRVFKEVPFTQTQALPEGTEVKLFHLSVDSGEFNYKDLCSFIRTNIGNYVFSRAEIVGYEIENDRDQIAWDAADALQRSLSDTDIDIQRTKDRETLGQILLYSFLEYVLGAPKVFSRFELKQSQGILHSKADALHLLPTNVTGGISQFILGASYIDNAPLSIIEGAFDKISNIKANRDNEVTILEHALLDKSFTLEHAEAIERIIIPTQDSQTTYDTSYGIFVGYSLGLKLSSTRDSAAYRRDLDSKLRTDLKQHASYIADKIAECGLSHHKFYIYTLPLNDARLDPSVIMNKSLRRREYSNE